MKNSRVTKLLNFVEKEADRLNSQKFNEVKIVKMVDLYKAFSLVEQEKCGPSGGLAHEYIEELTHSENIQLAMTATWVHLIVSLQLMKENQEAFRTIFLPSVSETDGERLMNVCDEGIKELTIQQGLLENLMVLNNITAKE